MPPATDQPPEPPRFEAGQGSAHTDGDGLATSAAHGAPTPAASQRRASPKARALVVLLLLAAAVGAALFPVGSAFDVAFDAASSPAPGDAAPVTADTAPPLATDDTAARADGMTGSPAPASAGSASSDTALAAGVGGVASDTLMPDVPAGRFDTAYVASARVLPLPPMVPPYGVPTSDAVDTTAAPSETPTHDTADASPVPARRAPAFTRRRAMGWLAFSPHRDSLARGRRQGVPFRFEARLARAVAAPGEIASGLGAPGEGVSVRRARTAATMRVALAGAPTHAFSIRALVDDSVQRVPEPGELDAAHPTWAWEVTPLVATSDEVRPTLLVTTYAYATPDGSGRPVVEKLDDILIPVRVNWSYRARSTVAAVGGVIVAHPELLVPTGALGAVVAWLARRGAVGRRVRRAGTGRRPTR